MAACWRRRARSSWERRLLFEGDPVPQAPVSPGSVLRKRHLMSFPERHSSAGLSVASRTDRRSLLSFWYFFILIAGVAVYYLFLLSNGTFQLFAPEMLDQVFDNMLVHLLRGDFTVNHDAIGFEVFTRYGKTYAYFGVLPALLRYPALAFGEIARAQLARLSCLTAVVLYVALQLRMLLFVHERLPPQNRVRGFLGSWWRRPCSAVPSSICSAPRRSITSRSSGRRRWLLHSTWLSCALHSARVASERAILSGWRSSPGWRSIPARRSAVRFISALRFSSPGQRGSGMHLDAAGGCRRRMARALCRQFGRSRATWTSCSRLPSSSCWPSRRE